MKAFRLLKNNFPQDNNMQIFSIISPVSDQMPFGKTGKYMFILSDFIS